MLPFQLLMGLHCVHMECMCKQVSGKVVDYEASCPSFLAKICNFVYLAKFYLSSKKVPV